jgi:hypothetical protein
MGGWTATVTRRGAATDGTDRSVDVVISATWVNDGVVLLEDTFTFPPGVTSREECLTDPSPTSARKFELFYSTERIGHWATFLDDGYFNEVVNSGVSLPAGCQVDWIKGIDLDHFVPQSGPLRSFHRGGYSWIVDGRPTNTFRSLDAIVNTSHDALSGVYVRVAYGIESNVGTNCLVTGLQVNP